MGNLIKTLMQATLEKFDGVLKKGLQMLFGKNAVGYCLILCRIGTGGEVVYTSDVRRRDMIVLLEEMVKKLKEDTERQEREHKGSITRPN